MRRWALTLWILFVAFLLVVAALYWIAVQELAKQFFSAPSPT